MNDILAEVRDRISAYQKILYLLSKPDNANRFSRDPHLLTAIRNGDIEAVKHWFKGELDSLTLTELRGLAQREGVYPVYGKNRSQLITDIQNVRSIRNESEESEQSAQYHDGSVAANSDHSENHE